MTLGENLQKYSFEYLLSSALAKVPDTVDKREGSIIYDALAPACYVLSEFFFELYQFTQATNVETATGEWLDMRVIEAGISRNPATAAVKKATFTTSSGAPAIVPIGSRFSTITTGVPLYFTITSPYSDETGIVPGTYLATCETEGYVGNEYFGPIVPLDFIPGIATATLAEYVTPGTDVESDENLLERYLQKVNNKAFAGNIAHYKEITRGISGVGGVQVYPVWNGGGTVKLSIVGTTFEPVTEAFLAQVQEIIDPLNYSGQGLGSAPINHHVTVVTPETYTASIAGKVTLSSGYTLQQVTASIESSLEEYFLSLRSTWDDGDELSRYSLAIYQAQIIRIILSVPGVANVTNVTINGASSDVILTQNATTQQIPMLGEVVLNEST